MRTTENVARHTSLLQLSYAECTLQILGQWAADKPRQSLKGSKEGEEIIKDPIGSRNSLTGLLMSRSESASAAAKEEASPASPLPDIDNEDRGDPLAATAYVGDIFAYYRRVESVFQDCI